MGFPVLRDAEGVVVAAHVDADYRTRMDVGAVLDSLDAAGART